MPIGFKNKIIFLGKLFANKMRELWFLHWTYPKKIFLGIILIWLLGTIFLYTPIAFNYSSYQYINNEYVFVITNTNETLTYSFLDAMFTSASAFTNTGLTTIPSLSPTLSFFGQLVVFLLIEVGGFGYISFFYLIGKAIRKITKKQVFTTSITNIERGGTKATNHSAMITKIFFVIIGVETIFALIFSFIFYAVPFYEQETWSIFLSNNQWSEIVLDKSITFNTNSYDSNLNYLLGLSFDSSQVMSMYHNYALSLWNGIFLSGSAINNAGLELFGSYSLQFLRNDAGISIQLMVLILILIGGIGFPVVYDILLKLEWMWKYLILYKIFKKNQYAFLPNPKFTTFTKLCLFGALIVSFLSILILFLTEYVGADNYLQYVDKSVTGVSSDSISIINYPNNALITLNTGETLLIKFWGNNPSINKNFAIIFNALSSRSAGFATINFVNFTETSTIMLSIFMFIGPSPSSTGGGVRTTTLCVISKVVISWDRGVEKASVFKRKIPLKTVKNAFIVLFSALMLILLLTFVIFITSSETIINKNLVNYELTTNGIKYGFSAFLFEVCSAFGTCGFSIGIIKSTHLQVWNLLLIIILMFIGQLGMTSTNILLARKYPKKQESYYLEENILVG